MNLKDKIASKRTTTQYTLEIFPQKNIIGNVHNVNPNFKTTETPLSILGWDTTSIDTTQIIFTYEGPLYGFAIVLLNDGDGNMVKTWIGEITSNMLDNQYIVTFNKMHTMIYYYTNYYNKQNLSGIFDRIPFGVGGQVYLSFLLLDDPFLLSYIDGYSDKTIYWDTQIDNDKVIPFNDTYTFKYNIVRRRSVNGTNWIQLVSVEIDDPEQGFWLTNNLLNTYLSFTTYAILKSKGSIGVFAVPILTLQPIQLTSLTAVGYRKPNGQLVAVDNTYGGLEKALLDTTFASNYVFEGYFNGPKLYETNYTELIEIVDIDVLGSDFRLALINIPQTSQNYTGDNTAWQWQFEGIHRTLESVNVNWRENDISMYIALQFQSPTFFNIGLDFNTLTYAASNTSNALQLKTVPTIRYANKLTCQIGDENNIMDFGEPIPLLSNSDLAQAIANANVSYNNGIAITNNQATFNASKLAHEKYVSTSKNPLNILGGITEKVFGEKLGGMGGDIATAMTDWKNIGKDKALTMEDENNKKMLAINRDNNIALAKSNTVSKLMSTSDISYLNFVNSLVDNTGVSIIQGTKRFWSGIFSYPIRLSYLSNTQQSILSEAITKYGIISPFFSLTTIDISIRPFYQYIKIKYWLVDSDVFDIANRDLIIHLPNYNVNQYMLDTKEALGNGFILELST